MGALGGKTAVFVIVEIGRKSESRKEKHCEKKEVSYSEAAVLYMTFIENHKSGGKGYSVYYSWPLLLTLQFYLKKNMRQKLQLQFIVTLPEQLIALYISTIKSKGCAGCPSCAERRRSSSNSR